MKRVLLYIIANVVLLLSLELNNIRIFDEAYSLHFLVLFNVLIIFLFQSSNKPSHFSFFAFLLVPYSIINFVYIYKNEVLEWKFIVVYLIGFIVFFSTYNLLYKKPSYKNYALVHKNRILVIFLMSIIFCLLIRYWMSLGGQPLISKAIGMIFNNALVFFIYGSLFSLLSSSRSFMLPIFIISIYLFILNYLASDISRLSILEAVIIIGLAFYFRLRKNSLEVGSTPKNIVIFVAVLGALCVVMFDFSAGGDALIFSYAQKIIKAIDDGGNVEPFMPLFNGGLILIPEVFWTGLDIQKPKYFNSSAWTIINILDYDVAEYKWGVGVSAFGAGYLYGGLWGIFILFFVLAVISAMISRLVSNPFFMGFSIIYNFKILFCIIRMDETFVFGAWIVAIPILCLSILIMRKTISGAFNVRN